MSVTTAELQVQKTDGNLSPLVPPEAPPRNDRRGSLPDRTERTEEGDTTMEHLGQRAGDPGQPAPEDPPRKGQSPSWQQGTLRTNSKVTSKPFRGPGARTMLAPAAKIRPTG